MKPSEYRVVFKGGAARYTTGKSHFQAIKNARQSTAWGKLMKINTKKDPIWEVTLVRASYDLRGRK